MLGMGLLQVADQGSRPRPTSSPIGPRPPGGRQSASRTRSTPPNAWALRKGVGCRMPAGTWGEKLHRPKSPAIPAEPAAGAGGPRVLRRRASPARADGRSTTRLRKQPAPPWPTASAGWRTCRLRLQDLVVILTTSLWAGRQVEARVVQQARRHPLSGLDPQVDRQGGPATDTSAPVAPARRGRRPRAAFDAISGVEPRRDPDAVFPSRVGGNVGGPRPSRPEPELGGRTARRGLEPDRDPP